MKKYKYLPIEEIVVDGEMIKAHRIQALIDIPLHKVKKGDTGGFVSGFYGKDNKKETHILSHKGSCWVGGNAVIVGAIKVINNALITDNATVKGDEVKSKYRDGILYRYPKGVVCGDAVIKDSASVVLKSYSSIAGKSIIKGNATYISQTNKSIHNIGYSGTYDVTIQDNAHVEDTRGYTSLKNCSFSGDVKVKCLGKIVNANVSEGDYGMFTQAIYDFSLNKTMPLNTGLHIEKSSLQESLTFQVLRQRLEKLKQEYDAYRYDIVQIIRYPLMTDMSDPDIANFVYALKEVNLMNDLQQEEDRFLAGIKNAEKLFMIAESKSRTIMDTKLENREQNKLMTAKKLLSVALDDGSNEHEKKISCERVLKELRGLIPLEDKLVENLRITVGLKELEA